MPIHQEVSFVAAPERVYQLLAPEGNGTRLVVDHDAYPEGSSPMYPTRHEHLSTNWPVFYFEPFAKYFAA
jgi:hypothetical protein